MMNSKKRKPTILVYGMDKAGYSEKSAVEHSAFTIQFVPYDSADSLADADGIILPSGIFEIVHRSGSDPWGRTCYHYSCDAHREAEREKQISNALARGAWICFALSKLVPERRENDYATRIATQFFYSLTGHEPRPHLHCTADEFRDFFTNYGIAQTSLGHIRHRDSTRTLATSSNGQVIYAAELSRKWFFMPLKTLAGTGKSINDFLLALVESILCYKRRNDSYLPSWLNEISFAAERSLVANISQLEQRIAEDRLDLENWTSYKSILSASGRGLNETVVKVLRRFFKLTLKSEENFIEDAIIYDHAGAPAYVVEIKGVNAGIRREHINQVDSHRERLGIDPTIPGLLVINDFSVVEGIANRKAKPVDANHLTLAKNINVRILRTTSLIEIMLGAEPLADRGTFLLQLLAAGSPLVSLPAPGETPTMALNESQEA